MSIIQDIRDKYAKVAVVAIALALIGFILTDYFSGRGRGGGGRASNSVGSVNGTTINADEFAKKMEQVEANYQAQGYPSSMVSSQALSMVWEEEVRSILLGDEIDKLGMRIGKKELGDILYGPNMPADLKQQLVDENGNYDPVQAKQKIDMMLKDKKTPQDRKDNFNNYVEQLKQQRLYEKYTSLLVNSTNFPRWFVEKQNADNSLLGKISVVRESYAAISDSTVKIDDKEIADYISKHKKDYRQEESRNIAYVSFNASPTTSDTLAAKQALAEFKAEFDTTTDVAAFVARNGNTKFFDGYTGASQMQMAAKDTLQKLGKGQVFGPYLDNGSYMLAKMIDMKVMPDSVKCRHILLGTADRSGNPLLPDSVAYAKADSVAKAIQRGANFDTLEARYTTDQAAHADKGVMTFSSVTIQSEGFAKEFGDFILNNPPGTKKVVKTQFGWHYIEIMAHIKPEQAYKIAYLQQPVTPSAETDNMALEEANQFAADSRDEKGFDAAIEKTQKAKGRVKAFAPGIKPMDGQVPGIGFSRPFVRDIYDAKKGEVLKPVRVDDNYIVAVVTGVFEEGTKSAATARMEIEPILRNKKKAALLIQKIGKVSTLEAASAALGGKPIEAVDSVRVNSTGSIGYEPRVSGATFNPANKGKVVPEALEGQNGVYVVRVESVGASAVTNGDIAQQRQAMYQQNKQESANPAEALKKAATIKDKRSTRY